MIRSVYVHAPFCARRCFYCDFAVQVRRSAGPEEWVRALRGELDALEAEGRFLLAGTLETLYVGGGTPSLLGPYAMARLADVIGRERLSGAALEWTAEANPESLTLELATAWRRAGVNRVSLGVQSFEESALRWMGRLHGAGGAFRAVETARRVGFDEISVDLMFGLPSRLDRSWTADLDRVVALEVPHISLYGLTVEGGTPLGRAVAEGRERVADEERYREEFLEAAERLRDAGYDHYEVSNFARPGSASRHNDVYWGGGPYLGLGNSAHSHLPPVRRWNLADWDAYRTVAGDGRLPVADQEALGPAERRLERIWLGLRTRRGLAVDDLGDGAGRVVRRWVRDGLATVDEGTARLTAEGWLVMDRLAVELDGALGPADAGTRWAAASSA